MTTGKKKGDPQHTAEFKIEDAGVILSVKKKTEMGLDYLNK